MNDNEKIEITVQPIKKIVVFQTLELDIKAFLQRVELTARTGQPLALNWAEGMIFVIVPYQPSSKVIIEQALKGTMYWSTIVYSSMPKYQSIIKFGAREVPIIDQTPVSHLKQVATWLKKKIEKTKKT